LWEKKEQSIMSSWKLSAAIISLFLAGSVPAQAQQTASQGWLEWSIDLGSKALNSAMAPIDYGWSKLSDVLHSGEAEIAAEKEKFLDLLRNHLEVLSKNVDKTGLTMDQVSISPDFIPKISLNFEVKAPVSDFYEAILRKEFEQSPDLGVIQQTILLALLDVDETAADFKMDGYRFSEVDFELVAIFPEMTLTFQKEDAVGQTPSKARGLSEEVAVRKVPLVYTDGSVN
jgi:hypothetical protein